MLITNDYRSRYPIQFTLYIIYYSWILNNNKVYLQRKRKRKEWNKKNQRALIHCMYTHISLRD